MNLKYLIVIYSLLFLHFKAVSQQRDVIDALLRQGRKVNTALPVLDSLVPLNGKISKGLIESFKLSKEEVRAIQRNSNKTTGARLVPGAGLQLRLIDGSPYFHALKYSDSVSLAFISRNKPFYSISVPVIFDNGTKAIIDVELVGGGGSTILMVKRDGKWEVENEYVRWVV